MRMLLKEKKRKKYRGIKLFIIISIFITSFSFMFIIHYSNRANPILISYAEAEVKKLTILVINRAVTKELSIMDTSLLFDIKYNEKGEIQLIDFNTKNTTKILSTMTSLVELNLRAIEEGKIDMLELPENSLSSFDMNLLEKGIIMEIPLGVMSNASLLRNIGPKVPVKLSLVGDVVTGLSVDVKEYGINSALLTVNIDVSVNTSIVMPINSSNLSIDTSIPIAIKVIQGKIPDYYLNGFTSKSNIVPSN